MFQMKRYARCSTAHWPAHSSPDTGQKEEAEMECPHNVNEWYHQNPPLIYGGWKAKER